MSVMDTPSSFLLQTWDDQTRSGNCQCRPIFRCHYS